MKAAIVARMACEARRTATNETRFRMSIDRFVHFDKSKPTPEQVRKVLIDYTGRLGDVGRRRGNRIYVAVCGVVSPARRRAGLASKAQRQAWGEIWAEQRPRGFDVYLGLRDPAPYVDVITRVADELTNAIAAGFVEVLAIAWQGRIET